jgi:hypothetical protein
MSIQLTGISLFIIIIVYDSIGKHAPAGASPERLVRQAPKYYVTISSGFAIYDKDVTEWRTFYQLCHSV